ncbi:Hypothetical protein LUCI_3405 [Lucifera butyrica]|uniref:DUF1648 domain-containing protein n=1 Tax=Lucifera butyrica TaxID=1351585 RepID=A0A498RB07_9FIRM|nr:Hypothetical protein LUCI_3405 [Lucifera butyrica]
MDNNKKLLLQDWPVWALLVLDLAVSLCVYPHLPARVPIHWNLQGQPNGWASFLLMLVAVTLLPVVYSYLDFRKNSR